jgi:hypothetical protein
MLIIESCFYSSRNKLFGDWEWLVEHQNIRIKQRQTYSGDLDSDRKSQDKKQKTKTLMEKTTYPNGANSRRSVLPYEWRAPLVAEYTDWKAAGP